MEIPKGESETCEFKQSISDESVVETICAFLNKRGGELFLGISDDGRILGVDIGKNTVENLAKLIKDTISPKRFPVIEVIPAGQRSIVKITVPDGEEKPYFCKGKAFIRLGKANIVMQADEIERLFKQRFSLSQSFEESQTDVPITQHSSGAIDYFYTNAREGVKRKNADILLRNLRLERNGKFNIAGLTCFGESPQMVLPQFTFRCGLVKKGELMSIDLIEGNIFEIIEKTFDYIKTKVGNRFEIHGAVRKTIYEYPLEALREAIVNSLIHRDFQFSSSNYLAIYEDHIEIRNPGELPSGLEISQLKQEHASIQRNKRIAHVLYLAGYIESWGTGTTKMLQLCRAAGLVDPEFIQENGFFKVRFWKKSVFGNPRLEKALAFIKNVGSITSLIYSRTFKISDRMARIDLKRMHEQGFIERQRQGKKIIYVLKS